MALIKQASIFCFVWMLVLPLFQKLQAQSYSFNNYSVQDGLAQSNILGVVQDKQGYIWLGTESGVSRFDGKNFKNYTTDDGLMDNNISCMLLDRDGNIWFGHGNGMVTLYDGKKFINVASPSFPQGKNVYTIFQDKLGQIWFSLIPYGLVVLKDPRGDLRDPDNYFVHQDKDLGEQIYSVSQDKDGVIWVHTRYGMKFLNAESGKFEYLKELSTINVTSFFIDKLGRFWLGNPYGQVYRYLKNEKKLEIFTSGNGLPELKLSDGGIGNFVNYIFEDSRGEIWFALWDGGVSRFNKVVYDTLSNFSNFNTSNGLPNNKIRCISEDREGNMLFGTFGSGLSIFKGGKFTSLSAKDGLVNDQVWAILQDKPTRYWFATNEGLSIYSLEESGKNRFRNLKNIAGASSNSIRSLTKDKDGNVWIGTWGSKVIKYDKSKESFTRNIPINDVIYNHISSVFVDSKNKLWIASPVGLTLLDLQSGEVRSFSTIDGISENDVTCIFEDKSGNMWFGTKQRGINKYSNGKFTSYGKQQGITNGSISSITQDKNGTLWIGTAGGGLYKHDGNAFVNYRIKDGLSSDYVTLVISDEAGNLWVGTNNGLCKFDPQKKRFTIYGKMDGFTGVETKTNASFKDDSHHIWFGTANGVFAYDPKQDKPNLLPPLTLLTGLRINNSDFQLKDTLELSYKENSLTFRYMGISISNPDEVKYAVKLDGYDENWRPLNKQNSETFSNLPPGQYVFNLKSYNSEGVEIANPITVAFSISPPIWKTWWFYVLVGLTGITILFAYIKIRERALIQEKRVLENTVQERTAEVVKMNHQLAEKNKDILDSIHYAKRIQQVILPPDEFVRTFLPQTFILFKPKDIVSGDFYWLADKGDKVLFAAVDCTGHGVPGAFMSIVGHNLLEQIVNEHGLTQPSEILEALNKSVSDTMRQSYIDSNQVKDGMEAAVCMFNRKTKEFQFAGSMNPLYYVHKGELIEIKGDKLPLGNLKIGEQKKFTNHSLALEKGDTLYIFSDGYADQFGGDLSSGSGGKKFKYRQMKDVIMRIQHLGMEEQGAYLDKTIVDWMGELDQIDDILVIGTRL